MTAAGNTMVNKKLLALSMATGLLAAGTSSAEIADNAGYQNAYSAWAAAHFALLPTSFLPGPIGDITSGVSIGVDVILKFLPASFVAPQPPAVIPNANNGCNYEFHLPRVSAGYSNLFGLADIKPLATNWSVLGTPTVKHAQSDVEVRVSNRYLANWDSNHRVSFPSGIHTLRWSASTQLDPLLDVALPIGLIYATNKIKYLDAFFSVQTNAKTAARAVEIGGLFLINAGIEAGLIAAGQVESDIPFDTAEHVQLRYFTVLDKRTPVISASTSTPGTLEATDFGGEKWARHSKGFRSMITASDPCGLSVSVGNDAPVLLPIGTTRVTWTVKDNRPLAAGNTGMATVFQDITVEDTLTPILLAPPSRVVESNMAATTDDFDIGNAVVFDLADPDPEIENTIPVAFPANSRTEVIWRATDDSGNKSTKSQWITVKAPGANTPPSVSNLSDAALTSEIIDLELMGSDGDFISGRFDPLKFSIVSPPANGFFVAPLLPYFIEDYRVRPSNDVFAILELTQDRNDTFYDTYCAFGDPIPNDFVLEPQFVHITDSGVSYVLDEQWHCGNSGDNTSPRPRISKWDADGALLAYEDIVAGVKRLTTDDDGFVYTVIPGTASEPLFLVKLDRDLQSIQSWKLDANTPYGSPPNRMLAAKIDPASGLLFANNKQRIVVYDSTDGQFVPAYLGSLKAGESFLSGAPSVAGSSSRGFYMEIDNDGNLYVVDSGTDRIHKFEPSTYINDQFIPGDYIGWLGRCDSGPNCDDPNGRSFGYSCNDADCTVAQTSGNLPGQFNDPIGIALDPEGTLYVTDYNNQRVQRFTALGDFAGEAASTCDGTCFVLGDMGSPLDISVNSTKFYVLDRNKDLMHVFETAPFKDITEDSVIVAYASNNNFQGIDTFQFKANDGLVDSNTATASITVTRNFRAPEAFDSNPTGNEDTNIVVDLLASDPDGIAGVDFNGLDTLEYIIVEQPANGVLSGTGKNRNYLPDANFNGSDSIRFKVTDGMFESEVATVSIVINPVNDKPLVRFTDESSNVISPALFQVIKSKIAVQNKQVPLGFPLTLMAEYEDPDFLQAHSLQIDWGDGSIENVDQQPPAEPENGHDEPVISVAVNSTGQIYGSHVYTTEGLKTISLLVIDDMGAGGGVNDGASIDIEVVPMVDVVLTGEPAVPEPAEPGAVSTLVIEVINALPESPVAGLSASNVQFTGTVPAGASHVSATPSKGSCNVQADTASCDLGTLAPGETVTISIEILTDEGFLPDMNAYLVNVTSTGSDATGENLTLIDIPVKSQIIFKNDFD